MACYRKRDEIAVFLINAERNRVREEEGGRQGAASYNMESSLGHRPWFWTSSARIMEEMITLDDLEVTAESGCPLLWYCARYGLVSGRVATDAKLAEQYLTRWHATLPLEIGKRH